MTLDPRAICRILVEEGTEFVIIGGFAAAVRGSTVLTFDVDVVANRDMNNLERLAQALVRLNARLRTGTEVLPLSITAEFLAQMQVSLTLTTDFGDLDLVFLPAGPKSSYAEWAEDADELDLGDTLVVAVASLEDIIASKRAANRVKDQAALPALVALWNELNPQG